VIHYDEGPEGSRPDDMPEVALERMAGHQRRDPAELSETIKQRICARTSERVRDLEVICESGHVVIRGRCATFYTKQLAQHAAMGVIEDETVVNEISVGVRR
jgi:osmotically-inducible protein OsmY